MSIYSSYSDRYVQNCPATAKWANKVTISSASATCDASFSDGTNDYQINGSVSASSFGPVGGTARQVICNGKIGQKDLEEAANGEYVEPVKTLYRLSWYGWERFVVGAVWSFTGTSTGSVSGPIGDYLTTDPEASGGELFLAGLFMPWDQSDPWYSCAHKIWASGAGPNSSYFTFGVGFKLVEPLPDDPYTGKFLGKDCQTDFPYGGCIQSATGFGVTGYVDRIEPGAEIKYIGPDGEQCGTGTLSYSISS